MNDHIILVALFIGLLTLSSCASLTGFEEGRVLGEGNKEFDVSLNFTRAPDLFDDDSLNDLQDNLIFPNIDVSFKYGINDKIDIGVKGSTNSNYSFLSKYQLVGDNNSKFALSPGLEIGTILGHAYTFGIPVYTSYYPNESITINFTSRFTFQTLNSIENINAGYLGGNFGVLFGQKNKFGFDIGYYSVGVEGISRTLFTVGVGGKFPIGDN